MSYKPEIQGLRAIAVLLVYFAHSRFIFFDGGFIGVDVFLVISGYVITLSLINEYQKKSFISISNFFIRRFWRLAPALFFMLTLSSAIALVMLAPYEQIQNYGSLQSAYLWISNFYFLFAETDYFTASASENLFLHTWSLGLEEQFYLAWPFILLYALGYFSKNKAIHTNRTGLKILISFLIVSLLFFVFLILINDNNRAFYLTPARFWQFASGAIIAYIELKFIGTNFSKKKVYLVLSLIGLLGIFLSAILLNSSSAYPSWFIFIPTISTILVIYSGCIKQRNLISSLLSNKVMTWLGDISYSVYLWHWPILYFHKKLDIFFDFLNSFTAILLTLCISSFSYYFIERKLTKKHSSFGRVKTLVCFLVSITLFITYVNQLKNISQTGLNQNEQLQIHSQRLIKSSIYSSGCDSWYSSSALTPCLTYATNNNESKTLILLGDSVAAQWFDILGKHYGEKGWRVIVLTKSSCPIVNQSFYYKRIKQKYTVCDNWRKSAIQFIQTEKPELLIFGNSNGYSFSEEQWYSGTLDVLNEIHTHVESIGIIGGTPLLEMNGPTCISRKKWLNNNFNIKKLNSCETKYNSQAVFSIFEKLSNQFQNVSFFDFNDLVCPNNICSSEKNGQIVYRDATHIAYDFINSISDLVVNKMENSLNKLH